MLSIKSFSAGKSAASIADYVQQKGAETYYGNGYWGGEGSKSMNLDGDLKPGELERSLAGRHPETDKAITNKVDEKHKPGWDLTFSAPKSVSVIWAADPAMRGEITTAHEKAVAAAMDYLEKEAFFTRHGHSGISQEPVLDHGGLIYSVHHHAATRAGDPGLHSHTIVANMTADGRSLDFDTRHKMLAGALYRVELADQMKQLGFGIERDGKSFGIVGVDVTLQENWSKRAEEIKQEMQEKGLEGAESAAKVASATRLDKTNESEPEAFKRWEAEANEFGYDTEKIKHAGIEAYVLNQSPKDIIDELVVNESTVSELQFKAASIQAAQGIYNAKDALNRHETVVAKDSSIVRLHYWYKQAELADGKGVRITTKAVLERETRMLKTAEKLANRNNHPITAAQLKKTEKWNSLSQQQKEAVAHLTTSGDLSVLQGWAGTGKTFALSVAVEAWTKAGYNVIATAPSNQSKEELNKAIKAEVVINTTALEIKLAKGQIELNGKTILIIDEAGMEGSRRIGHLLEKAAVSGAKVVLQGDTKQLQSVEAGAAMRGIIQVIGAAELGHDSVVRQKHQIDREIAEDVRHGRTYEAINKLFANGSMAVQKDIGEAYKSAAAAYLSDKANGQDPILVACTRHEVKQLNQHVREVLKESGEIDKNGQTFRTASGAREFAQGDKVVFGELHRFDKKDKETSVHNGSRGVVQRVTEKAIYVKLDSSKQVVKVEPHKYNKIDHGHAATVNKSQGASADTAHVVLGERGSLEWAYVAVSRHKEELVIHTTKDVVEREKSQNSEMVKESVIEKVFHRSSAKDLSTDYFRMEPPNPAPPTLDQPEKNIEPQINEQGQEHNDPKPSPENPSRSIEPMENREQESRHIQDNTPTTNIEVAKPAIEKPLNEVLKDNAKEKPLGEALKDRANHQSTPEQAKANQQKLNEAIKTKAAQTVLKVEAVKVIEKVPSKGIGMDI